MRVYWLAERMLPAPVLGRLDYLRRHHKCFYPTGGPMNAQVSRLEAVRQIIFGCQISRIIETGVFRGTTTDWFAGFGLPVVGAEFNLRFASFSKLRLHKWPNVDIRFQDSVECIKDLAADQVANILPTLFYLDAHWTERLPLREEIEAIFPSFPKAVVVIDDFKVPDDSGYGFDDYGPGKALTLDYLASANVPPMSLFFPATRSQFETGQRRGWVVATMDREFAQRLGRMSLLRPV